MSNIKIAQPEASNNIWINGLLDGERWTSETSSVELDYSLIDTTKWKNNETPPSPYKSYSWSKLERGRIEEALSNITSVSDITFQNIGNNQKNAQLRLHLVGNRTIGSRGGFAYAPDQSNDNSGITAVNRDFYNSSVDSLNKKPLSGSYYGFSILHEISHSLGLKHPHDKGRFGYPKFPGIKNKGLIGLDKGRFGQNAHPYTQMTYVTEIDHGELIEAERKREFGFLKTLGTLDIAAIQWLYGINPDHANEDNTYLLPTKTKPGVGWSTIWDTGGLDTVDGRGSKSSVTIDLRNANLGNNKRAGGSISAVDGVMGGFTIAHDWDGKTVQQKTGMCVIENAVGGPKNDVIRGNYADNELLGGHGNDQINGGNGNDTLIGGRGKDVLKGGPGRDQFVLSKDMVDEIEDFSFEDGDTNTFVETTLKKKHDLQIIEELSEGKPSKEFTFVSNTGELYAWLNASTHPTSKDTPHLIAILITNPF
jgi:serralysin